MHKLCQNKFEKQTLKALLNTSRHKKIKKLINLVLWL